MSTIINKKTVLADLFGKPGLVFRRCFSVAARNGPMAKMWQMSPTSERRSRPSSKGWHFFLVADYEAALLVLDSMRPVAIKVTASYVLCDDGSGLAIRVGDGINLGAGPVTVLTADTVAEMLARRPNAGGKPFRWLPGLPATAVSPGEYRRQIDHEIGQYVTR